jgi:hypothetical protein
MKKLSLILALAACIGAPAAQAQYPYQTQNNRPMECWNPRAGHFEGVRPGETQNDLDFARCRPLSGYPSGGNYPSGGTYRGDSGYRGAYEAPTECWNPYAGHFEGVRPGEVQNDLDFSRCRTLGQRRDNRYAQLECWNPRARHYEGVREGERQDDLDFSRCRRR